MNDKGFLRIIGFLSLILLLSSPYCLLSLTNLPHYKSTIRTIPILFPYSYSPKAVLLYSSSLSILTILYIFSEFALLLLLSNIFSQLLLRSS